MATSVGESPVESVLLVELYEPGSAGFRFDATSLPGHLLHYMLDGRVRQECNGRRYELGAGNVLWYHEDELVRGEVVAGTWRFYSILVRAPTLPPPGDDARVATDEDGTLRAHFAAAHAAMHDPALTEARRAFAVHAAVNAIFARLAPSDAPAVVDAKARLWWHIETMARRRLHERLDLAALAAFAKTSQPSVVRSCRAAVGTSPMKRLKRLRLSLARGLVQRSDLAIGAIATRVGYGRVHEFSRDYRAAFAASPRADRQLARDAPVPVRARRPAR